MLLDLALLLPVSIRSVKPSIRPLFLAPIPNYFEKLYQGCVMLKLSSMLAAVDTIRKCIPATTSHTVAQRTATPN